MAAAGDDAAFEAIFERHHRGVLTLCRHMLGSPEEAEDAVQHTFAAAYRQLVEREPPEHPRAWLYRTARNRCLDVLRRRREVPGEVAETSGTALPEEVERRSDLRDLVADIGRLPEQQRAALVLSELEDLDHAEVARVLGCRTEKVRALVYQARSALAGWREARELPCREVREELSVAQGGALRRGHLRRHLKICPDCRAFREDMRRQRDGLAAALPVLPAAGLQARVLEGALGGGGAGGAAAGSGAGAGLLGSTAVKVGAAVMVLGVAGLTTVGGPGGGGSSEREPSAEPVAGPSQTRERDPSEPRREREPARTSKRLRAREQPESVAEGESIAPEEQLEADPEQAAPGPEAAPEQTSQEPAQPPPEGEPPAQSQPQAQTREGAAPQPGAQTREGAAPPPGVEVELEAEADPAPVP